MKKLIAGTMVALSVLAMTGCSKDNGGKWYYYEKQYWLFEGNAKEEIDKDYYLFRAKIEDNTFTYEQKEYSDSKKESNTYTFKKENNKYLIDMGEMSDSCYFTLTNKTITYYEKFHESYVVYVLKKK